MPTSPPHELRGALHPRVEVTPAGVVGTDGGLAAQLMEAAGKPLESWQRDGLDLMMSVRDDGKWACYEYAEWVARQQGKGVLGEARATFGLLVLDEEITWSAHLYSTALIAFRRLRDVFRALGEVHKTSREEIIEVDEVPLKVWNSNDQRGFERLDTGHRIGFFSRSKRSLRGASPDVNLIDEAFAYSLEEQDAIMPTLIAKPNAQTIYLSSPPLAGDSGEVMYALKERVETGHTGRLGYRDWGLEGHLENVDRVDVDDRRLWAATCPGVGRGRVTGEAIQAMRDSMSRAGFGREVLGLWPKRIEGGGAIDIAQWADLRDPESKRDGDVALAVDIAPLRDYAAVAVYGQRVDGVGHMQLVDYRPGTEWVVDRVVDLAAVLRPVAIGMGRAVAASLEVELGKHGLHRSENVDEPVRGDLVVTSATEMSAAAGQMLDAVKQGTFRHIDQHELNASVSGAKIRQTGDTLAWARKEFEADTSPLVAVSVAKWAFEARAHLVQEKSYDVLTSVW